MRKLSGGDIAARLARIDRSGRGRRWRKKAKAKLLRDQDAVVRPSLYGFRERGAVCHKIRHATLAKAREELSIAQDRAAVDPRRREQRVYQCPHCRGYHLTSWEVYGDGDQPTHEGQAGSGQDDSQEGPDRGSGEPATHQRQLGVSRHPFSLKRRQPQVATSE